MNRLFHLLAPLLLLGAWPQTTPPQTPEGQAGEAPAFPAGIELVTVDAVVVDKDGHATRGLTKGDFNVLEDGVPQKVTAFEAVVLPDEPPPAAVAPVERPPYSSNQAPEARHGRTFVLVFDDIHLTVLQAQRARVVMGQFLRTGVRDGDRVCLISTGGGAWWCERIPEGRDALIAILKRLDGRLVPDSSPDRVTDYEAMRIMTLDDQEVGRLVAQRFDSYGARGREKLGDHQFADSTETNAAVGIIDPYVRARSQEVYSASVSRRNITLSVMRRALGALAGVKGRKAMVLVSQGFIYEQDFKEMKELVSASLRVNVPVYFIDTQGLKALPDFMTAQFPLAFDVQDTVAVLADLTREAEGSEAVALDTGGFVIKNTNDLESGILRVSNESQAFYLLGYTPSNPSRDGKFRRIEVKLNGASAKGLKVRARRGYYAPSNVATPAPKTSVDPEIARALDSPFEKTEVPLRVAAFCFDEAFSQQSNVIIAADIDVRDLAFREEDGRAKASLAFLIEAQRRETGEAFNYDQQIDMALLPETRKGLLRTGYTVSRDFVLPAGSYQARVVVRDLGNGRLGSVIHDFDVPDPSAFRLTTPIISDAVETKEAAGNGPPRPVLQVGRRFTTGSMLYVQYSVLGAARGEASRLPHVSAGYEIRRADGSLLKAAAPTRLNPTSLGALIRFHGISLGAAEPGQYELVLTVRDEITGKTLESHEPFTVVG
jgi:VWFA-related protein